MWCPSTSLSVWANAWLAGRAAPDDVLDALSAWAPVQSVAVYDAISIGESGLAWAGGTDGGAAALLQLVRGAGPSAAGDGIRPVFPVPGDVRGLPAGTIFAQEAILAGEAVLIGSSDASPPIGLVPAYSEDADAGEDYAAELCWTVFPLTSLPASEQHNLGDAEYALRSAVRTAAEALGSTGSRWADYGVEDPRLRVEQMVEAVLLHRIPDHAPNRAVRVLHSAAHVEAIITVSADLLTASAQSSAAVQRAADAVAPLTAVVRSARSAAVTEILHSAWRA
ncbi:hypothetical protein ABW16_04755 [Mycolicibacter heraklionensis]|uniref:Uncharacterized protein n=1 Tax=Mycolicibacter heraklionensis TaxID=512402 RepID=A0ABR5FJC9_9MYCO|nr:hypothetical protein [Mycolicibacter heraklionensis]KLO30999.1 hypothetical protein ABW16_04755 [Mycolicibacter heraklionensis]